MLRKKEPKARKSILETLLRDMQGSAAQKLTLFAAGGFVDASASEVVKAEMTLRAFAAMEREVVMSDGNICPTCASANDCAIEKDEATCWCFVMPHVLPVSSTEEASRCYCRACLTRAIGNIMASDRSQLESGSDLTHPAGVPDREASVPAGRGPCNRDCNRADHRPHRAAVRGGVPATADNLDARGGQRGLSALVTFRRVTHCA